MKPFISSLFAVSVLAADSQMYNLTLDSYQLHGNSTSRKAQRGASPARAPSGYQQSRSKGSNRSSGASRPTSSRSYRPSTASTHGSRQSGQQKGRLAARMSSSRGSSGGYSSSNPWLSGGSSSSFSGGYEDEGRSSNTSYGGSSERQSNNGGYGSRERESNVSSGYGSREQQSSNGGYRNRQRQSNKGSSGKGFQLPVRSTFSKRKAEEVEEEVDQMKEEMKAMMTRMAWMEGQLYGMKEDIAEVENKPEVEETCMPVMDIYWVNEDQMIMDGAMANSFEGKMPKEMQNFSGDIKMDPLMTDICVPEGHVIEIDCQVSVETSEEMGFDMDEGADVIMSLTKDGFPSYARARQRVVGESQSMSLHYGEYVHEDTSFKLLMMQNASNGYAEMMVREKEAQMHVRIWPPCHNIKYEMPDSCAAVEAESPVAPMGYY